MLKDQKSKHFHKICVLENHFVMILKKNISVLNHKEHHLKPPACIFMLTIHATYSNYQHDPYLEVGFMSSTKSTWFRNEGHVQFAWV